MSNHPSDCPIRCLCRPLAIALGILTLLLITAPSRADVKLPAIFGDHMILQRDKPVRIWGWTEPEESVTVRFADQEKVVEADLAGEWAVELAPMAASDAGRELVVEGAKGKVTLSDVLVGEVWICGGQSNMEWQLRSSRDADLELECADYPALRYIRLPKIARPQPQKNFPVEAPDGFEGNWRSCVAAEAMYCTAVGYYFGRRLHRRLKVPVGLIDTSWGGTMAQHWVSTETLRPIPAMQPYFDTFEAARRAWIDGGGEEGAKRRYEVDLAAWEMRGEPREKGKRIRGVPNRNNYADPEHKRQPGGMFNGMIMPLAGVALRGVLFYQGENNSFGESWKPFPKTFPAVIADWRNVFGADLPFGIIQIAGWSNRRSMTYDMNHHTNIIREIQFRTWRTTPGTGLIVTFDTNSDGSIHPRHKAPVGERSARWALAEVYGVNEFGSNGSLNWKGPVYGFIETGAGKITVTFEEAHGGLRIDQDDDCGFYVAGKDRQFHPARARVINVGKLEVFSDDVPEPVAVRYGWSNLPAGGLMNGRELPAYPFRSDTWPLVPHQSKGAYEVTGSSTRGGSAAAESIR